MPTGWGCLWASKKKKIFLDTVILDVLRDIPISQIQPLKSADY